MYQGNENFDINLVLLLLFYSLLSFSEYITHPLINNEKGALNLTSSANLKFSDAKISGFKYSSYKDYNIAVGLSGHRNFRRSILYGSPYSTNGIIEDRIRDHSHYFTKVNADGYYIHYLPKGIIATLKAGGNIRQTIFHTLSNSKLAVFQA